MITRTPAARRRHDDIRSPAQGAVLQDRLGRERLQQRSGNDPAVGNAEPVTELKGGTADDDLLVPELVQRRSIAAQHIEIGHFRDRSGADAEIDQEGRALFSILSRQHRAHRREKLPVELLAIRVASDHAVRFNRDIDDC
jgi:hypothetical protein